MSDGRLTYGRLTYDQLQRWPAGTPVVERRYLADAAAQLAAVGTPCGPEPAPRAAGRSREQGEYRCRLARIELESWPVDLDL
jgi:hypothetical protein